MGSRIDPYRYGKLSPRGHYGALMASSDAVVAAAIRRVNTRSRRGHAGGQPCVIEYRKGSGTEIRRYSVSPLRQPIMAGAGAMIDARFLPQQTAAPGLQGSTPAPQAEARPNVGAASVPRS